MLVPQRIPKSLVSGGWLPLLLFVSFLNSIVTLYIFLFALSLPLSDWSSGYDVRFTRERSPVQSRYWTLFQDMLLRALSERKETRQYRNKDYGTVLY